MNKNIYSTLLLGLSGAMLLVASSSTLALSTKQIIQMKACKLAVLNKPKLHDLPMAAISLHPGEENHVRFTIRWEGTKGHGNCKVSKHGNVEHVKIQEFHHTYKKPHQGNSGIPKDIDGFHYNSHTGAWLDPDGEVCHTCTPENGFPAARHQASSAAPKDIDGFYYDRHTGQWRDPDGEVCHSCTPENGFPSRQH